MRISMRYLLRSYLVIFATFPLSTFADPPVVLGVIQSDTAHSSFGQLTIIRAGDQNADGFDDFWTWDTRLRAFLYRGTSGITGNSPAITLTQVGAYGSNLGDYDGDGFPDYAWKDFTTLSKLFVYLGGPLMDSIADYHYGLDSSTVDTDLRPFGKAQLADFDSSGVALLAATSSDQASVLLYRAGLIGDSIQDLILHPIGAPDPASSFGWGMAAGNFVGSSCADLAVSLTPREVCACKGQVWLYYGGEVFDTIPELRFTQPGPYSESRERFGRLLINLGDVNGDGYDDLFAGPGNSADSLSYIYFGGGAVFDTVPDVTITEAAISAGAAGDVNNDGFQDLIIGLPLVSSVAAYVYVYYGGPDLDSLPDVQIYASDLPIYTTRFGSAVAGIGDFNGDGVDDFAAGAEGLSGYGVVVVFSGTGIPVGIWDDDSPRHSKSISLYQNYPNPFNSSTSISFELPRKEHVVLTILNLLGREVIQLVNKELTSGVHEVTWNGCDRSGAAVSSGLYLCRIQSSNHTISRKVLLLK